MTHLSTLLCWRSSSYMSQHSSNILSDSHDDCHLCFLSEEGKAERVLILDTAASRQSVLSNACLLDSHLSVLEKSLTESLSNSTARDNGPLNVCLKL